jgi:hypothetical protein
MGPSAYHAKLAKDQCVEDREGVKVIFAGGSVFHIHVSDLEKHISVRGVKAAWERAEAERRRLNPEYGSKADGDEPVAEPEGEETGAVQSESDAAPDNEPAPEADEPSKPDDEGEADVPPVEPEDEGEEGDADESEGEGEDEPRDVDQDGTNGVVAETREVMVDVDYVEELLGDFQGRLPEFRGDRCNPQLRKRVRATDGRCAPIFFVEADDGPAFFAGLETLGAALDLGMKRVPVVILSPTEAQELQGSIAAAINAACAKPDSEDDEMIWRAYN